MLRCKTCDQWCYGANNDETLLGYKHQCPPKFEVIEIWWGDKGEINWNHAHDIYASDAEEAAEKYRDKTDAENAHFPNTMDVAVKDKLGNVTKWCVEMESVPQYSATPLKEEDKKP